MAINRRNFLLLSGLAILGVFGLGKQFGQHVKSNRLAAETTASTPETLANFSKKEEPASSKLLLRFIATADSGSGNDNQYAVAAAMAQYHQKNPFKLAIMAGDNIYDNGEIWKVSEVFEQPYHALLKRGVKFRACLGNHDIRTDNGNPQVQYVGFNMQDRYYTFREGEVQFFALDTNGNANWDAQLVWLEQELQQSNARWKIVFGHHPIYASGTYGSDLTLIKTFSPLFKQYGVQLYINGHEHHYERTNPIEGTTYLVTGHGGAYLRAVGRSDWTAYSVSRYGFSAIEVYGDRIEIKGIGTDHQVFDRGVITSA